MVHLCAVDFTVRQFIAPVALALERDGHRVTCVCSAGPHRGELRGMGLHMHYLPIARSANPLKAAGAVARLVRWLRKTRPDVLHVHTPVAGMIGRLAGWIAGVPKIVYTAHGFYFHDRMPAGKRRLHVALERTFGFFNHWLLCVSREDVQTARRLRIARRRHILHVPNGADPRRFAPNRTYRQAVREELAIPQDAFVAGMMGRMVREKGYGEFLTAARALAREFPDAHFLLIGDTVTSEHDDAKAQILSLAEVTELQGRVHFAGLRRDPERVLAALDLFALPSYREGMPVSIIEAMLCALPVVATRIRGCREVVQDGETGFLVEPEDADELEGAMRYLMRHREAAAEMGRRGRDHAVRHHDERRTLWRQVRFYRRLAEARR